MSEYRFNLLSLQQKDYLILGDILFLIERSYKSFRIFRFALSTSTDFMKSK